KGGPRCVPHTIQNGCSIGGPVPDRTQLRMVPKLLRGAARNRHFVSTAWSDLGCTSEDDCGGVRTEASPTKPDVRSEFALCAGRKILIEESRAIRQETLEGEVAAGSGQHRAGFEHSRWLRGQSPGGAGGVTVSVNRNSPVVNLLVSGGEYNPTVQSRGSG